MSLSSHLGSRETFKMLHLMPSNHFLLPSSIYSNCNNTRVAPSFSFFIWDDIYLLLVEHHWRTGAFVCGHINYVVVLSFCFFGGPLSRQEYAG